MRRLCIFLLCSRSIFAAAAIDARVVEVATLKEPHEVGGLEFSADGAQLIAMAGAYDSEAHVWNWRDRKVVATLSNAQASPTTSVSGRASPDGQFFVHCGRNVTVWDARTWKVLQTVGEQVAPGTAEWPGVCQSVAFSPDGSKLVILHERLSGGPNVSAYTTASWNKLWNINTSVFYPKSLAFDPDGKHVAIGGQVLNIRASRNPVIPTFGEPPFPDTGLIAIVDVEKQAIVKTISIPETSYTSEKTVTWQGSRNTLTYGAKQSLRTFDAASGALLEVTPTESIYGRPSSYLSPNGRIQIESDFGAKTELIRVVDVSGIERKVLREIQAKSRAIAWSRDSRYFAIGGAAFSIAGINPLLELMAPSKGKVVIYEVQ